MLPDEEIDRAAIQLAEYRRNDALGNILDQYAVLLESYKRLKSDYEEEREGRERYKQLARGQERNPFALVLVDGDGYVFNEAFLSAGDEGGSRAAKQLNDAVKASLRRKGLEGCEIMIRVYANLVGLSKSLCKNGLCGAEKRFLSSFVAGFNRSYGLTDFVDAGELKECADVKLRKLLGMYAENTQCKIIYFAAGHDVGYVSDLTPYRGNRERFTLIRTPSLLFHKEFDKLGMNIEEFPGVFRSTPLIYSSSTQPQIKTNPSATSGAGSKFVPPSPNPASSGGFSIDNNSACQFFALGKCKYGNGCRFSHIDNKMSPPQGSYDNSPSPSNGSRSNSNINSDWRCGSGPLPSRVNIDDLPRKEDIPEGYVAVNAVQDRLDAYLPAPTADARKRLKAMSAPKRFCNNSQLFGTCDNEACEYEHNPIPDDLKGALEELSRSVPCSWRGACMKPNCVYGHVCQKADCRHRGGKGYCRFSRQVCTGDYKLGELVPVVGEPPSPPLSPSVGSEDARNVENGGTNLWF